VSRFDDCSRQMTAPPAVRSATANRLWTADREPPPESRQGKSCPPRASTARDPIPAALRSATVALAAWSVLYVIPHAYWALGGERGFFLLRPSAVSIDEWETINAVASVVLLSPVIIAFGLRRFRADGRARIVLLGAALIGASIATAHGLYGILYRVLNLTGIIEIDGQRATVADHPWVLWDLVIFEPWFLIEGILFLAAGWTAATTDPIRRRWLLACTAAITLATLSGVLGLRFA
jgi:hypothetical protein